LFGIRLSFCFAALSFLVSALLLPAHAQETTRPYVVPNTDVFDLHSEEIDQTYEIRVALPDSYGTDEEQESYPLLVLLDADYSFAIARNVVQHLAKRNNQLPEMIIVAIAYPGAEEDYDLYHRTRTRDYTPFFFPTGGYGPEIQQLSGGGPAFLNFIENELFPVLEDRYPVSETDRTLEGHSYGGLFTTWVLLTRPDLFARWIIVSPSYWYADDFIFDYENEFAAAHDALHEVVFTSVGSWEVNDQIDMVELTNRLTTQLRDHEYEGLSLDTYVFPDDTHASIWPAAFTRGARSVFSEPLPE
jgi:predicted alpha/beta superfamily hydrolase